MGFHLRKPVRIWPFYWVFTLNGFASWGVKIGRVTYNITNRQLTIDTPGPGYWQSRRRKRSQR